MKYPFKSLLGIVALFGSPAEGMPPRQHRANGIVESFNRETSMLVIAQGEKNLRTGFIIKGGRTRLRQDGKKVTADQVPVGHPVRLYYKRELGTFVVTEISWRSAAR